MPDVLPPEAGLAAPLPRVLLVGCGALGRELVALTRDLPGVDVTCLPAELHNRPERIPDAVAGRIRSRGGDYDRVFVAYADCGTGGALDRTLAAEFEDVERIPGAHCYEFYAGGAAFAALQDEEPGTFYLTDFLARHFERLVVQGLGLNRHPDLLPIYFGNYRRLVYLAQTEDPELVARARAAAERLGLEFELRQTGLGELAGAVRGATDSRAGVSAKSAIGKTPRSAAGPLPADMPLPAAVGVRDGHKVRRGRHVVGLVPATVPDVPLRPASAGTTGRTRSRTGSDQAAGGGGTAASGARHR
jgi:hypothetical protein